MEESTALDGSLVYDDKPNLFRQAIEKLTKSADFAYSLGFSVQQDGRFVDVIVGSPVSGRP